jgi:hypothetical protein
MGRQAIKNPIGSTIGWIVTTPDGEQSATTFTGRTLGRFDRLRNVTRGPSGHVLAQGYMLSALVYNENERQQDKATTLKKQAREKGRTDQLPTSLIRSQVKNPIRKRDRTSTALRSIEDDEFLPFVIEDDPAEEEDLELNLDDSSQDTSLDLSYVLFITDRRRRIWKCVAIGSLIITAALILMIGLAIAL